MDAPVSLSSLFIDFVLFSVPFHPLSSIVISPDLCVFANEQGLETSGTEGPTTVSYPPSSLRQFVALQAQASEADIFAVHSAFAYTLLDIVAHTLSPSMTSLPSALLTWRSAFALGIVVLHLCLC